MFVRKKAACLGCGGVQILRPQNGRLLVECRSCGDRQLAKPEVSGHPLLISETPGRDGRLPSTAA